MNKVIGISNRSASFPRLSSHLKFHIDSKFSHQFPQSFPLISSYIRALHISETQKRYKHYPFRKMLSLSPVYSFHVQSVLFRAKTTPSLALNFEEEKNV